MTRVQDNWDSWNNQPEHMGSPSLGTVGACTQSRRDTWPISGASVPDPILPGCLWALGTLTPALCCLPALPYPTNALITVCPCLSPAAPMEAKFSAPAESKVTVGNWLLPEPSILPSSLPTGLSSPCLSCTPMCSGWFGVEDRLALRLV